MDAFIGLRMVTGDRCLKVCKKALYERQLLKEKLVFNPHDMQTLCNVSNLMTALSE